MIFMPDPDHKNLLYWLWFVCQGLALALAFSAIAVSHSVSPSALSEMQGLETWQVIFELIGFAAIGRIVYVLINGRKDKER